MGGLLLDFPIEGVFPFHPVEDDGYLYGFRLSPRVKYDANKKFRLVVSPAFQMGREDAITGAGLRYFRYQPDPRLTLGHFRPGSQEMRLDVPEAYLQFRPSSKWQVRLGRNYWDNTMQKRMRDWSFEGFTDGNIGDSPISLGAGGDLRYSKPYTRESPVDLKISLSGGIGARREAIGLIQGLATFLPRKKSPNSPMVVGASLSYAHYPEGALAALLPGVPENAAGGGISGSLYLQQGIGQNLDLRVGYARFVPTTDPTGTGQVPLGGRSGLTVTADYHKRYWGLHLTYGKVWRDDLAGVEGTRTEDLFGVAGRWMALGDKNRNINLTLGTTFVRGQEDFRYAIFGGLEIALQDIHLK